MSRRQPQDRMLTALETGLDRVLPHGARQPSRPRFEHDPIADYRADLSTAIGASPDLDAVAGRAELGFRKREQLRVHAHHLCIRRHALPFICKHVSFARIFRSLMASMNSLYGRCSARNVSTSHRIDCHSGEPLHTSWRARVELTPRNSPISR